MALTSPSAGHKANEQERQAALRVAEEAIARMGHPPHTQVGDSGQGDPGGTWGMSPCPCACPQVEILPQGRETPLFKQFFSSWK